MEKMSIIPIQCRDRRVQVAQGHELKVIFKRKESLFSEHNEHSEQELGTNYHQLFKMQSIDTLLMIKPHN